MKLFKEKLTVPPAFADRQSRQGENPFISALTVACGPATFTGVWPHFGTFYPQVGTRDGGFHIRKVQVKGSEQDPRKITDENIRNFPSDLL